MHKGVFLNNLRLLGLMNVRFIITRKQLKNPDLTLVHQGTKSIYENRYFLPRYRLIENFKVLQGKDNIFNYMKSSLFRPDKELVLEEPLNEKKLSIKDNNIQLIKWTEDKIEFNADIKNKCLFSLSEIYYPKWKAYINNEEVRILKANYSFRAILLPQGQYKVKFEFYNNGIYLLSFIINYLVTLLLISWILYLIVKKKM